MLIKIIINIATCPLFVVVLEPRPKFDNSLSSQVGVQVTDPAIGQNHSPDKSVAVACRNAGHLALAQGI